MPTSSAMAGHSSAQSCDELRVGHASGREVVAEQVGVGEARQRGNVVGEHRGAYLGLQRIAGEDGVAVTPVFRDARGVLKIEAELAQPVIPHALHLGAARRPKTSYPLAP